METKKGRAIWIMTAPDNTIYMNSAQYTRADCWKTFCYPALNRKAYEKEGWRPIKYKLELHITNHYRKSKS